MKKILLLALILPFFVMAQDRMNGYTIEKNILGSAYEKGDTNTVRFIFTTEEGEVKTFEVSVGYDIPYPAAGIFEDGSFFIVNGFEGIVHFYSPEGYKTGQTQLEGAKGPEYERAVYFQADGNFAVFMTEDQKNARTVLSVYDSRGGLISAFAANKVLASGIAMSEALNRAAVSTYNLDENGVNAVTEFFDLQGTKVFEIPERFTSGIFTEGYFTGITKKDVFRVNLENRQVKPAETGEGLILDIVELNGNPVILKCSGTEFTGGSWVYRDPALYGQTADGPFEKIDVELPEFFRQYSISRGLLHYDGNTVNLRETDAQ